ncbi:uncharacterized protein EV422DRAFT_565621 [Fimicolochytrium jonesii]|uniref:uncharacterized protein n=1 Tax=Fimicolochytrium jonesii TaxID=1396493 RepID=UPI0022FEAA06|nr:uncharacterized protein EV422DRAFT_565621 [Fimicolochytrium jonesii]KAI8823696.1 hypothetical protein EV422DRAFT_565621 [Fimicolochytrium jonesii]
MTDSRKPERTEGEADHQVAAPTIPTGQKSLAPLSTHDGEPSPTADTDDVAEDEGGVDYRWLLSQDSKTQAPILRGTKEFGPDGSNAQSKALEESRNALHTILQEERRASSRSMNEAEWDPHHCVARVTVQRGTYYQAAGTTVGSDLYLLPEEALFMIERNAMMLTYRGGLCSMQQAFDLLVGLEDVGGDMVDMDGYQVYAYLKRLGYAVLRTHLPPFLRPVRAKRRIGPSSTTVSTRPSFSVLATIGSFGRLFNRLIGWLLAWWLPRRSTPHWPIVDLRRCRYSTDVFRQLQIIPRLNVEKPTIPAAAAPSSSPPAPPSRLEGRPIRAFNVYKPRPRFKKSDPGPPDFRVVVQNVTDPMFDVEDFHAQLRQMDEECTQLKIGIVDGGNVSFLAFGPPAAPPIP